MQPSRIIPELQCSVVCEDVRREANGKFMLIGVLNYILVPQLPVNGRVCIFNQWTAGIGQFREAVRIVAPDGSTVLAQGEVRFAVQDPAHYASNLSVFGLKLEQAGVYQVEVRVEDVLKLRYPLPVAIAQQQPGGQTGTA
jgi:hypothetical protein